MKQMIGLICIGFVHYAIAGTAYVSLSGSHTSPFDTLPKAATNIQSAVNISTASGDVVLIDGDEYMLTSPVVISDDIIVKALDGPATTIINGAGVTNCFELADVGCVLSGLTITNGYTVDEGGGVSCAGTSPVITNCVIAGCYADYGGGIEGGTIYHSILKNNTAVWSGGGAYFSKMYDSLVLNNMAINEYGGGAEASKLSNCTIINNTAPDAGGVDNCDITNSIIYFNSASVNADAAYSTVYASCLTEGDALTGSYITNAPVFEDMSGGDYHLQIGSPGIDQGDNAFVLTPVDLDGHERISGGTVDMGAYETQVSPDQDNDGMGDAWEIAYLGGTNAQPAAHADADMQNNIEEYIAGTDPTNSASFFAVTHQMAGDFFVVEWPSFAGREYKVLWSGHLPDGFIQQGPMIAGPQSSYTDMVHSAESSGFYKVEVQLK